MTKSEKSKLWLQRLAIAFAVFIPLYFIGAMLGHKFGVLDLKTTFALLTKTGPKILIITAVLAAVSFGWSAFKKQGKNAVISMLALAVPLAAMAYGKTLRAKARSVPPIHDITTNTQDPPVFTSVIMGLRGDESNPVNYVGKTFGKEDKLVSAEQERAYPDITTIALPDNPDTVFDKSVAIVDKMGWKLQSQSREAGIIEATDETLWLGFKDDVIIRIRAVDGGGSHVDIRSISRVGGSDIGVNAARVREFTKRLTT